MLSHARSRAGLPRDVNKAQPRPRGCKADVGLEIRLLAERRRWMLALGCVPIPTSLLQHGHQRKAVSPAVSARGRWPRYLLPPAIFTAGISCTAHCVCPYSCPQAKDSRGSRVPRSRANAGVGIARAGVKHRGGTAASLWPYPPSPPSRRELPFSTSI